MKKKFILTLLALVCALCCAFGLAACGDDGEQKKTHSQQQWGNAFDAALGQEQYYTFKQGAYLGEQRKVSCEIEAKKDARNALYSYISFGDSDESGAQQGVREEYDWVMKNGDKYYTQYSWDHSNYAVVLTADTYASKEARLTQEKSDAFYAPSILEQLRPLYSKFKLASKHGGLNGRNATEYEMGNATLTFGEVAATVARVGVAIYDDADELAFVTLDKVNSTSAHPDMIVNAWYEYNSRAGEHSLVSWIVLPEIKDKTFKMAEYELDLSRYDSDPEKHDGYQEILGRLFNDNYNNKTATFNADGTITGDMSFGDVAISTYTWSGDIDDITVSNADNPGVAESDKFTLTGAMVTSENGHRLVLHLTVPMGGGDTVPVTFYYGYAS